jgi:hypothetical protein
MPALLKKQSIWPYFSITDLTYAFTSSDLVTSAVTAMASPPFWRMMPAVASAPASSRSTTFAPWRANATDAARPIPLPLPVTSATLPVKSFVHPLFSEKPR